MDKGVVGHAHQIGVDPCRLRTGYTHQRSWGGWYGRFRSTVGTAKGKYPICNGQLTLSWEERTPISGTPASWWQSKHVGNAFSKHLELMGCNTYTRRSLRAEVSLLFLNFAIEIMEFQTIFAARFSGQVLTRETQVVIHALNKGIVDSWF